MSSLYTVTFHANGGAGVMADQTGYDNAPLNANTFTKEGFSFIGWNSAADGSGTTHTAIPGESLTLYAQWQEASPPTIALNGSAHVRLFGTATESPYVEQGAAAQDELDASPTVAVTGSVGDAHGQYEIVYTATNSYGLTSQVSRLVTRSAVPTDSDPMRAVQFEGQLFLQGEVLPEAAQWEDSADISYSTVPSTGDGSLNRRLQLPTEFDGTDAYGYATLGGERLQAIFADGDNTFYIEASLWESHPGANIHIFKKGSTEHAVFDSWFNNSSRSEYIWVSFADDYVPGPGEYDLWITKETTQAEVPYNESSFKIQLIVLPLVLLDISPVYPDPTVSVTFDAAGGDAVQSLDSVDFGTVLPVTTRAGWEFSGWLRPDGNLATKVTLPLYTNSFHSDLSVDAQDLPTGDPLTNLPLTLMKSTTYAGEYATAEDGSRIVLTWLAGPWNDTKFKTDHLDGWITDTYSTTMRCILHEHGGDYIQYRWYGMNQWRAENGLTWGGPWVPFPAGVYDLWLVKQPGSDFTVANYVSKGGFKVELRVVERAADYPMTLRAQWVAKPVITLQGAAEVTVALGGPYPEATANDNIDGDISVVQSSVPPLDLNTPGTYEVTYNAANAANIAADPVTQTVTVAEAGEVVITLNGPAFISVERNSPFSDPGATASNGAQVLVTGGVETSNEGVTTLTYSTDGAADVTRTVEVFVPTFDITFDSAGGDEIAPLTGVEMLQPLPLAQLAGQEFAGWMMPDGLVYTTAYGPFTPFLELGNMTRNAGQYATASDGSTIMLTLTAGANNYLGVQPVNGLTTGDSNTTLYARIQNLHGGALVGTDRPILTTTDNGNEVASLDINFAVPAGNYDMWMRPANLDTGAFKIQVQFIESAREYDIALRAKWITPGDGDDTIPPLITLLGDDPMYVQQGSAWSDPGFTAVDNRVTDYPNAGDYEIDVNALEGSPHFGFASVSTNQLILDADGKVQAQAGEYSVYYSARDSSFNFGQATRTVIVTDGTKPVITLTGGATVTVEAGATYDGPTANDNNDGDITGSIEVSSVPPLDLNTPGTYTVTYSVQDAAGNAADPVTQTVEVVDTTKPVITIYGGDTVTLNLGDAYQAPTASDNADGDITGSISNAGDAVDTAAAGTYVARYNVTDAAGNAAQEVAQTVIVQEASPPTIALNGSAHVRLFGTAAESPYVEQSAAAQDELDASPTVAVTGSVGDAHGQYEIVYTATNSYGLTSQVSRLVTRSAVPTTAIIQAVQFEGRQLFLAGEDLPGQWEDSNGTSHSTVPSTGNDNLARKFHMHTEHDGTDAQGYATLGGERLQAIFAAGKDNTYTMDASSIRPTDAGVYPRAYILKRGVLEYEVDSAWYNLNTIVELWGEAYLPGPGVYDFWINPDGEVPGHDDRDFSTLPGSAAYKIELVILNLAFLNINIKPPPSTVSVTFDTAGGDAVQSLDTAALDTTLPASTRAGWEFSGWMRPDGNLTTAVSLPFLTHLPLDSMKTTTLPGEYATAADGSRIVLTWQYWEDTTFTYDNVTEWITSAFSTTMYGIIHEREGAYIQGSYYGMNTARATEGLTWDGMYAAPDPGVYDLWLVPLGYDGPYTVSNHVSKGGFKVELRVVERAADYPMTLRAQWDAVESHYLGAAQLGVPQQVFYEHPDLLDFGAGAAPLVYDNDASKYVTGNGDRVIEFEIAAEVDNAPTQDGLVICGGFTSDGGVVTEHEFFGIKLGGGNLSIGAHNPQTDTNKLNFFWSSGDNYWYTNDLDPTYPDQYLSPTATFFNDGQWRTVRLTYRQRVITVTVDGQLEVRFRIKHDLDTAASGLVIGKNRGSRPTPYDSNWPFGGRMRNIRIYDRWATTGNRQDSDPAATLALGDPSERDPAVAYGDYYGDKGPSHVWDTLSHGDSPSLTLWKNGVVGFPLSRAVSVSGLRHFAHASLYNISANGAAVPDKLWVRLSLGGSVTYDWQQHDLPAHSGAGTWSELALDGGFYAADLVEVSQSVNQSRYLGELEFLAAALPQYTVSFDANGGETGAMADQTAAVGTALSANGFGRAGYGFAGWNTAVDGSGAAVATVPEGGGTLYAQWTDTETPVITMLGYPSITPEWTAGTTLVESVSGDGNLNVFSAENNPSSFEATVSGYPVLHLDANGNPMDYDPENDSDYQWDYLNASGVDDALKNASETNPVVITYTFSNELLLSGIGHTQPNVANASRNSIRKFFIKTYDAADNVTRHPATGTFLATHGLTNTWETFTAADGFVAGTLTKRLEFCIAQAPYTTYQGPDSNGLYFYELIFKAMDNTSVWVHGRSGHSEGNLVTQATQDNQLDVYVGNGSDETLLGSVSGHPLLDTASDGTLVTSYNNVVDSKTWGGYLNAKGVGNALLDATPAQPVVITYTFASEVSLSQLAYTQFYAHNANRHSLRGFFVETVDASGAALRIPTDGTSLFSATPETTNEWEVFDLGGARKAKQLRLCIAEPPVYGGGNGTYGATATDSNNLYFYELIFRIDATLVPLGGAYADAGGTATDNVDGDLTASIVTTSTVNTAQKGTYEVRYDVSDAAGNPAAQVVRTVQVVEAPSMALQGGSYVVATQGQTYADAGASASLGAEDLGGSITVAGAVDTDLPGEYELTYSLTHLGVTQSLTRKVLVVEPPPPDHGQSFTGEVAELSLLGVSASTDLAKLAQALMAVRVPDLPSGVLAQHAATLQHVWNASPTVVAQAAPSLDLEWTAFGPTYEYAAAFRYGLGFEQHAERAKTAFGGAELATPRDAEEEAFLLGLCEGLPLMIGAEQFREGAWRDATSEELTYTNVVGTVAVGQALVLTSAGWAPAQDAAGALLRRQQSRQVTKIVGSGGADLVLNGELASMGELLALPGDASWTQHGAYEYYLESQSLSYAAHETTAATSGAVIAPVTTLAQNSLLTGLLAGAAQAFVGVTQDDAGVWLGDPSFYEGVDHKVTADVWEPLWSRGSTFEVVDWSPSGFTLREIHPNGTYDHVFVEQSDGKMRGTASFTTAVWYLTPSADGQWIGDPNFYGGLDHVVTADVWEPLWSRGSTYEVVNWLPSGFTLREVNSNGEYDHVFVEQSDGRMRGTASFTTAVWYLTPNPAAGEPSEGWKSDGAPLSFTAWDQEASPGWSLIGSTATEAQFDSALAAFVPGSAGLPLSAEANAAMAALLGSARAWIGAQRQGTAWPSLDYANWGAAEPALQSGWSDLGDGTEVYLDATERSYEEAQQAAALAGAALAPVVPSLLQPYVGADPAWTTRASRAWRVTNGGRLTWRPGLHMEFYDVDGNRMQIYGDADPGFTATNDPNKEHYPLMSDKEPFHSSFRAYDLTGYTRNYWDGWNDATGDWRPSSQMTVDYGSGGGTGWDDGAYGVGYSQDYAPREIWMGLKAAQPFEVGEIVVRGSFQKYLKGSASSNTLVLQRLVSGDPPQDAWPSQSENDQMTDSGVWEDVASVVVPANGTPFHASFLAEGATTSTDATLSATFEPRLFLANDGTTVTPSPPTYTVGDLVIKRFTQSNAYGGDSAQFGHEIDARLRWLSNSLDDWMEVEFGQEFTVTGWETGHTNGSDSIYTSITVTFYDAQGNQVQTLTHSNDASVYDNRQPAGANYHAANKVHTHTFETPVPNVAKMRFDVNAVNFGSNWGVEHLHVFGHSPQGPSLEWHSRTAYGISQADTRYRPSVGLIMALSDVASSESGEVYGTDGSLQNYSMQGHKTWWGHGPLQKYRDWQTKANPDNPPAVVLQLRRETELHGIGFRSEWMLFTDASSGPLHNYGGGNNWRGADRTQMENRDTFPKRYRVSYRSAADANETDHSGFVEIGTYDAVVPLWTHSVNSAYDFAADGPLVFDNDSSRYVTGNGDRLIDFEVNQTTTEITQNCGLVICGGFTSDDGGVVTDHEFFGIRLGNSRLWISAHDPPDDDHDGINKLNFFWSIGDEDWYTADLDPTYAEQYLTPNPTFFSDGQWRRVRLTYRQRVITVTVDGQLEVRFRIKHDLDTAASGLVIGKSRGSSPTSYDSNWPFNGRIRNLAIYDTVDVGGSTVDGWERQYLDAPVTALQVKLELLESYDAIDQKVRVAQMTFLSQEAGDPLPATSILDISDPPKAPVFEQSGTWQGGDDVLDLPMLESLQQSRLSRVQFTMRRDPGAGIGENILAVGGAEAGIGAWSTNQHPEETTHAHAQLYCGLNSDGNDGGYLSFNVQYGWWMSRLSSGYSTRSPDDFQLFVDAGNQTHEYLDASNAVALGFTVGSDSDATVDPDAYYPYINVCDGQDHEIDLQLADEGRDVLLRIDGKRQVRFKPKYKLNLTGPSWKFQSGDAVASNEHAITIGEMYESQRSSSYSGYPYQGTVTGLKLYSTDNLAHRFDGTQNTVVPLNDIVAPQGNSPRRVEIVFRTTQTSHQCLLSTGTGQAGKSFNVRLNAGNVGNYMGVMGYANDYDVVSPVTIIDGQWHTLVADFDGSTLRLWIDGVFAGSKAMTFATEGQSNYIGRSNDGVGNGNEGYVTGDIHSVKLWGTSTASPEPYGGGGAIVDMSSGAILLIGDDAIVAPQSNAPRRVEVEFKTAPGDNHYGVLLSTGTGAAYQAFNVRIHVGGQVGVMGVDRDWDVDPDPIDVFDGEWHTLVVDYDGTHLRMWLDGVQLGDAHAIAFETAGQNNVVGRSNHYAASGPGYFRGEIRSLRFFDKSPVTVGPSLWTRPIDYAAQLDGPTGLWYAKPVSEQAGRVVARESLGVSFPGDNVGDRDHAVLTAAGKWRDVDGAGTHPALYRRPAARALRLEGDSLGINAASGLELRNPDGTLLDGASEAAFRVWAPPLTAEKLGSDALLVTAGPEAVDLGRYVLAHGVSQTALSGVLPAGGVLLVGKASQGEPDLFVQLTLDGAVRIEDRAGATVAGPLQFEEPL